MKLITLIVLFTYSLMAADAESAAMMLDYESEYQTAIDRAKKEHKMVLMVIVQDPCPYCDKLVHKTLDTPAVQKRMKNYVPLVVDKHGAFPKQFKPPFIPMSYIIDPNEEKVTFKIVGSVPSKDYIEGLDNEMEFREE